MSEKKLTQYQAWDRTTRWFHWINVFSFLGLIAVGTVILNGSALGIPTPGKTILKTVHVLIGYVFAINLAWRLVWLFIGSKSASCRAHLPLGKDEPGGGISGALGYLKALKASDPPQYIGHTPPGRYMVSFLFLLLIVQAVTGIVIAGTDIYYPPFGGFIAEWVAAPGIDPTTLIPKDMSMVDKTAWDEMRAFREPFATIHYYVFFTLLAVAAIHIFAVIRVEAIEKTGLISAMFSGVKTLSKPPADKD